MNRPQNIYSNSIQKYQFIHHFVPHPVHRTRATLLSHHALIFYSFLLVLFLGLMRFIPVVAPGVLGYASDINVNELLSETNNVRKQHGLKPLVLNPELSSAAEKKAAHMFKEDYWAHVSPSGVKPWDFILDSGYDYSYAGENLAKNFDNSDQVVVAWYKSPSHRENLLNDKYDEIGFAVVNGVLEGYETTLVVQMFGKSRTPIVAQNPNDNEVVEPLPSELVDVSAAPQSVPENIPSGLELIDGTQLNNEESPLASPAVLPISNPGRTSVAFDVSSISSILLGVFLSFISVLLALDIWYSKKKGIPKLSGHTLAHLMFLIIVLGSVWLTLSPGSII